MADPLFALLKLRHFSGSAISGLEEVQEAAHQLAAFAQPVTASDAIRWTKVTVSASTVSDLNQKIYGKIEEWRERPRNP